MMWKRGFVALCIVLFIVGCTIHPARDGRVIKKYTVPAWTEEFYTTTCTAYYQNGTCMVSIPIRHEQYHPASWWVTLHSDKAAQKAKTSGRGVYADWPIHEMFWSQIEVGQHIHVDHNDEAPH